MKIEKILLINDDVEDMLAMSARFPEEIQVDLTSQYQAGSLKDPSYELVVLDNDANDLKESKGKETLSVIRKQGLTAPIVYTSFQPGWVPAEIHQTKGVSVVRTDEALGFISRNYGIQLRDVEKKEESDSLEPRLNIILTYNTVDGFKDGLHGDKLLIVSYDKWAGREAKNILTGKMQDIYQNFNWRSDRDLIRNVFVYDGVNGGDAPGQAAQSLGHDIRMKVNLLACRCDWDRKVRLEGSSYVNLYEVSCGGQKELGMIADTILRIRRPGVDYSRRPMSAEEINAIAERFRL